MAARQLYSAAVCQLYEPEIKNRMYSRGRIMSCILTLRTANRKGAKDAKGDDFFRIGTDDSEKDSSPPGNKHILPGNSSPSIDSAPSATCRVVARRAKPEADRLFSLADLRIGKRKLSVLCALSPTGTGGSIFSKGNP